MTTPTWRTRPEVGNAWWLQTMLWFAQVLGRPVARLMLYPAAAFFWLRTPAARADSTRYLTRVLTGPINATNTFRHYLTFSATILDRVYFLLGRDELFDIEVVGEDIIQSHLDENRGVFLVGAHLGSLEALRNVGTRVTGRRVRMAMYESNARRIGQFSRAVDPRLEDDIVQLGQPTSMLRLSEHLEDGAMIGFLADRAFGSDKMKQTKFLGHDAEFPTGVFRMAAALRCPVIAMAGLYLGKNRYQLHFAEIFDFTSLPREQRSQGVSDAIDVYARTLEGYCRLAPYNWFNFYDFWTQDEPAESD